MKRCAWSNGKPFRFAQHLERLTRGADFLKIKLPFTPKELEKFAGQLIEQNKMPDAILRVTLTRGPGGRGYSPNRKCQADAGDDAASAAAAAGKSRCSGAWSRRRSGFRPATRWSSFKTTSKILHVMARAEAEEKGADEALLLNTNGEVAETAGGNLFWVYQDNICTVPTGRGVLPGITRAVVLEICQSLGLETNKRVIKPEALRNADGHFRHAKRAGHRAGGGVRRRAGRAVAAGGPNRQRLQRNAGPAVNSFWLNYFN